ncbi:PPE family protein [Tsukamurella sp. 1534]|uniref:PPE family protein n=1 Tax=Tsukamurella sp. 1534 TaxID=1151061 RepID=UPI0009DB215B|nr:PPE family protein [Tsukamurella sp. 1534]
MTFPALPPEVNVGRLMSGAGPAPATAAAAAWSAVAAAVSSRSVFLTSLLPRLAASWEAPETALMTKNVSLYLAYNEAVRSQALLAATRHTKQAADYTAALAGMAQLPEIALNHITNAVLHATNFLGVNTAAIAANEAQYTAMWAQNAAMMSGYLANTVANMTFEPFIPPKPIATSIGVPIPAAAAGAASVGDAVVTKIGLAAQGATAVASAMYMRTANGVLSGTKLAQSAAVFAQRADQVATIAQSAEGNRPTPTGKELGGVLVQQLGAQVPAFAGTAAGVAGAAAGGALQGGGSFAAPTASGGVSFGSVATAQPLSMIMTGMSADNRSSAVGYFGARPGSPTLERLSKGAPTEPGASAVRGAPKEQVAAPSTWDTAGLTVAPPPPPVPRVAFEPLRPLQPVSATTPVARSKGRRRDRVVVPATAAVPIPVYADRPPEYETVPVDVPSAGNGD